MHSKPGILIVLLSLISVISLAQEVNEKQACQLAKIFYFEKANHFLKVSYEDFSLQLLENHIINNKIAYRVFKPLTGDGFIIVSGDESMVPVLAYSFENKFPVSDSLPPNVKEWMKGVESQFEYASNLKTKKRNPLWDFYSVKHIPDNKTVSKDVSPILPCTWNQGCGYNALCPVNASGPCGRVWAGCVATAMAQVMKYHAWPTSGIGSHSYTHYVYGLLSADFGAAVYDWTSMSNTSGNAEVAELIYHCGVSVNMNYSPSGSGAYTSDVATSLKTYFDYTKNLLFTSKSSYTDENWAKLLRAEIDEGRPLVYQGYGPSGGHAFNIDGYQGTDYFHLNWGWGGSYNGYYYLNDLTPGSYSFTNGQATIVGVMPAGLYPGLDASNPVVLSPGIAYLGTTAGSINTVNKYGNCYYHSTGKEVLHQITTSFPGRITVDVSCPDGDDLDVFILSHTNQDSLLAYGDILCFADNTVPGTYYIMVDGKYAHEGAYSLTVTVPTSDADLIITDQSTAPSYIEPSGICNVSFKIKNIGNASAPVSKIGFYYSDDNMLDGSDSFLSQLEIQGLNISEEIAIAQNVNIPASANQGDRYLFVVADNENQVPESDELHNKVYGIFNIPAPGLMDCSDAVQLSSDVWYHGNTETMGTANITTWLYGDFPANEVIHSFTATHNGIASVEFSEKIPEHLYLLVLPACNENSIVSMFGIWNPEDTLVRESFYVYSGITYYLVVDAGDNDMGEYFLKVNIPNECPEPIISYWGEINLCDTEPGTSLYTDWGYHNIQWYKDNLSIPDQTWSNYYATESGQYKVKVTENNCSAFSDPVTVTFSPVPNPISLTAAGNTVFCEGNDVVLNAMHPNGNSIRWVKNGKIVSDETTSSLTVTESGIFSAEITNLGCSVETNTIEVIVNPVTANLGDKARVNGSDLISLFSCDKDDQYDLSGNGNTYYYNGWTYPEDRYGIWNNCSWFNGQYEYTTTTTSFVNPQEFTISLWFKTNTLEGGRLIGFGDQQYGLSTISDRLIYMGDDGRIRFGIWNGSAKTLSSASSYNDNAWHFVAASLSSEGMKLYIDGQLCAQDPTVTAAADYTGWWKMAYDHIDPLFPSIPTSLYYKGSLDDVRIDQRSLLPSEIQYLFSDTEFFDSNIDFENHCLQGSSEISLLNTEAFIEYQLRNNETNANIGSPQIGNAGSLDFPTNTINETTTYNILATNPDNACSLQLNDLFTIAVNNLPSASVEGGDSICRGSSVDIDFHFEGTAPWTFNWSDGTSSYNETSFNNLFTISVSDSGIYSVTNLNDAYCIGSELGDSAFVVVNELPVINLGDDVTGYTNQTITLDAGPDFLSYLWSDASANQTLLIDGSVIGLGEHEFWVEVQNNLHCFNSDTILVTIQEFIDVPALTDALITISPNPTSGSLFISTEKLEIEKMILYNGQGTPVKTFPGNQNSINLSGLPNGVYHLQFLTEKVSFTRKIILTAHDR
jgi:hypothetical protein